VRADPGRSDLFAPSQSANTQVSVPARDRRMTAVCRGASMVARPRARDGHRAVAP